MSRRGKYRAAAVGAAVALVAGLSAGAAWFAQDRATSPLSSDAPAGALVVPVVPGERVSRYGVGVAVQYDEGFTATASTSGTVTGVAVTTGRTVAAGDVLMLVDDRPLVAFTSDAPLWRDVTTGLSGPDVERVQQFLTDIGLFTGPVDGRARTSTVKAVARFNEANGHKELGSTFAASSVVWIGPGAIEPADVAVAPGTVLGPGSPVLTGPRHPSKVTVSEPAGGIPAGPAYELTVGTTSTDYTPGSGELVDVAAVTAIAASLGTSGEGAGQVRSVGGDAVVRVPASAVVVDASGTTCVFPDASSAPVMVTVLGGALAQTDLAPRLNVEHVLANPMSTLKDPTCSSSPTR